MPASDDFEILPATSEAQAPSLLSNSSLQDGAVEETSQAEEMQCEIKQYEARYDLEGKRAVKEFQLGRDADLEDDGKFVMRLYRYYDRESRIEKVNLEIRSSHIRDAIRSVIGAYPGQNFTGNITLTGNNEISALGCLFHYRKELRQYRDNLDDAIARRHVLLLVDFTEREFQRDIRRFEDNIHATTPCIEFRDLWMLFKPDDFVFTGDAHTQSVNKVVNVSYSTGVGGMCPRWIVTAKALSHNGTHFGYVHKQLNVLAFEGIKEVNTLSSYPFQFHIDQTTVRKSLISRGQKYCSLVGVQHCAYDGEAIMVDKQRTVSLSGRASNSYPEDNIQIGGRIMLDCKMFIQERTESEIKIAEAKVTDQSYFTDEDFMLCHYIMMGFSLSEKVWCRFYVDFIHEVVFDDGAFDALLLPTRQKRLIRALTKSHTSGADGFDDLIQGKGQGCIFLLHGEPGIGKTFTAESIADDIKRPLYVLMSGELGTDVKTVDERLRKILKLVRAWNAVLLIDEADVFLEKRSSHDLERNSLVSIFLRTLEYFSGVLFLTTNRIDSFDRAFQSRIHLALRYRPLNALARARLWHLFLARTPGFRDAEWPEHVVAGLAAAHDLNGRQIKNAVRTAHALALAEGARLGPEQVRDVLETVAQFREDFEAETGERVRTGNVAVDREERAGMMVGDLGLPDDAYYAAEE
ncbi:hypothetical protein F4775DRAFT_596863 [Biscogniauxia sp. FL1348]|nr:hypothetical protein F4775DRAFT_596863 [Biscogniauxia sp. FL1348]